MRLSMKRLEYYIKDMVKFLKPKIPSGFDMLITGSHEGEAMIQIFKKGTAKFDGDWDLSTNTIFVSNDIKDYGHLHIFYSATDPYSSPDYEKKIIPTKDINKTGYEVLEAIKQRLHLLQ